MTEAMSYTLSLSCQIDNFELIKFMAIMYSKQALKYLRKMPRARAEDIMSAVRKIDEDRSVFQGNLIKMTNSLFHRLRIGDYRVILDIDDGKLVVLVLKIGTRGDVYK
ncbi:MAG: type II toxin-antitoxin system RelE/ParE family toxin [Desulfomicrobium sp.]|nr:type II toxin-antitoxin system RelE/ParE family toxin [Pseudomonadota bacterium]MBU4571520.1 type II toxin-antitoxin system RelE/ParE family toxin [Pseudomonadota bacterium]MBV1710893.1 type II toxin-antitoxin system RelE/ParE family toxin [Desulfomicrobium sp.]MBV1718626.1 type II toxin-antitoxin system RelE/ParE family toxin [Desulfomicrobium sp.]